jgi:hypothetical protein
VKGTNELTLNQETVCEAIQEYLSKRMPTTALRVTKVVEDRRSDRHSGYESSSAGFVVTITTEETLGTGTPA